MKREKVEEHVPSSADVGRGGRHAAKPSRPGGVLAGVETAMFSSTEACKIGVCGFEC